MDDIQRKKFIAFMSMLNDTQLKFTSLLYAASDLHEDLSSDNMLNQNDEKIANLNIIREAILDLTESAIKLIKISDIENKLK
jgi:hypothetical protein